MRVGVVFPGQGSQNVGMGADVAEHYARSRELFDRAATILGYDLLALARTGPDERLRETQFSQPAIFVTNVALFDAAPAEFASAVVVSAGHSFAEFCSLYIAGAISFEEALAIVDERGKAMQDAAERAPGGMSAVLGFEAEKVRAVVDDTRAKTGRRVQLANFNSPTQIVISGDIDGVTAAGQAMLAAGAKRVVPLNVSGAWHSALMEPAIARFRAAVDAGTFAIPKFDVVSNVDAQPYRNVETIRTNLVRSITEEVRWHETAERVLEYGLDLIVEFGASGVLGPLVKRMPNAPAVKVVSDRTTLDGLMPQSDGTPA